jgi:hypothetical protein
MSRVVLEGQARGEYLRVKSRENEPFVSGGNVLISRHEHHFDIIIITNGVSTDSVIFAVG